MKHIFKKITSFILASAIAVMPSASFVSAAEDEGTKTSVTVTFEYKGEGITIADDGVIENFTADANSFKFIPDAVLEKKGFSFSGWTSDGIIGYAPGDVIQLGTEDITLKPVWVDDYNAKLRRCYYLSTPIESDIADEETIVEIDKEVEGSLHKVSLLGLNDKDGKKHSGWIYDGKVYKGDQKIVVPQHDIYFTPNWLNFRKMTYLAGDDERVVGAKFMEFDWIATGKYELGASNRFSRKGFKLVGWEDEETGETYPPLSPYIMPDRDVNLLAVWEPINYVIVFNPGTGSSDIVKVPGATDTTITIPECTAVKSGYTFAGWKYSGKVYQPGEDFVVPGALAGSGIGFTAVWEKEDTTTTTTTTSTTTASSTTSSTTITTVTFITGHTPEVNVRLYIDKAPKSTYKIGEKFTLDGAVFRAEILYRDETGHAEEESRIVSNDDIVIDLSEFDNTHYGTYNVKLSYYETKQFTLSGKVVTGESTVDFEVKVAETVIPIVGTPGDANCDGSVNMADAVLIMQSLANPQKYKLPDDGYTNGDVDEPGNGITSKDALKIQQYLLGIVNAL